MRSLPAALLAVLALTAQANPALDAAFPKSSVVIATGEACFNFGVWLALERDAQARGLMHVRELGPWEGMLFVYGDERPRSMWMKNTLIPLDMLFIRADGSISSIASDTEPQSLASIRSREPVRYVLELNAGVSDRLNIVPGDRLAWEGDAAAPSQD